MGIHHIGITYGAFDSLVAYKEPTSFVFGEWAYLHAPER